MPKIMLNCQIFRKTQQALAYRPVRAEDRCIEIKVELIEMTQSKTERERENTLMFPTNSLLP